jgi:hypothetical protein
MILTTLSCCARKGRNFCAGGLEASTQAALLNTRDHEEGIAGLDW